MANGLTSKDHHDGGRLMSEQSPGGTGSCETFDSLVAAYEKKIFNVIYRIIGDYEEAADLTQETFISAFRSFSSFRGDASVYTWLYQIAINQCRNRMRQHSRSRSLHVESLDQPHNWENEEGGGTKDIVDESQAPHVLLEEKELRQRILSAVNSLPIEYREVVILREVEGLSYNEIAEVTKLSLENVKTRLSRARAMLRRKLEPYYNES
jgi:RNA polymerase sigma-70 factor (ECF subfamily)